MMEERMTSQARGEETRARILEAAERNFARNGYDATSVASICQQADVTKGGFYHHFPSKQAVFLELLNQWLALLDGQFDVVRAETENVPQALQQMAGLVQPVFQVASGKLHIFLEFWSKAARDPTVWQASIAPYRRYQSLFAHMIEAGVAEGTLREVDPMLTSQVIVSLAVGLVLQGVFDPHGADWGEVAQEGIRLILQALETKT
jgi:AcrR family transcriptional regulator